MLEDLDEEDAKKIKYVLVFGVAMVIFLAVLLWLMEVLIPTRGGKKKQRADVTLHRGFRF